MENGARYVVKTHWGVFSLDEDSYQDYLQGKLWISWSPGRKEHTPPQTEGMIPYVSDEAIALREKADKQGVNEVLRQLATDRATVPYHSRLAEISIDEMNLTVRSSNGLKRANTATFGRVKALLEQENGILSVRNLGQKSAKEITQLFFAECYARLTPYERAQYWQEILNKSNL